MVERMEKESTVRMVLRVDFPFSALPPPFFEPFVLTATFSPPNAAACSGPRAARRRRRRGRFGSRPRFGAQKKKTFGGEAGALECKRGVLFGLVFNFR